MSSIHPIEYTEIINKLSARIKEAINVTASLLENADERTVFTLTGMPPHPRLLIGRSMLKMMKRRAVDDKFRKLLDDIITDLNEDLDAFRRFPVPVDSLLKGTVDDRTEMPVISRRQLKDIEGEFERRAGKGIEDESEANSVY